MLPQDLSGFDRSWLEDEIDRREEQLDGLSDASGTTQVRDGIDDELQVLKATLWSKEEMDMQAHQEPYGGAYPQLNTSERSFLSPPAHVNGQPSYPALPPPPPTRMPSDGWMPQGGNEPVRPSYDFPGHQPLVPGANGNWGEAVFPRSNGVAPRPSCLGSGHARQGESSQQNARKRQLSSPSHVNPAQRTKLLHLTPSPGGHRPDSPASDHTSRSQDSLPDDILAAFGGEIDAPTLREMRRLQRQMELEREQQREREAADEEFARMLQEELDGARAGSGNAGASSSMNNTGAYQTFFNPSGGIQRNEPILSSNAALGAGSSNGGTDSFKGNNAPTQTPFSAPSLDAPRRPALPFPVNRPGSAYTEAPHNTAGNMPLHHNYYQQDLASPSEDSSSSSEPVEIASSSFIPSDRTRRLDGSGGHPQPFAGPVRQPGHAGWGAPDIGSSPIAHRPRPIDLEMPASDTYGTGGTSVYESLPSSSTFGLPPIRDVVQTWARASAALRDNMTNAMRGLQDTVLGDGLDHAEQDDWPDFWGRPRYRPPMWDPTVDPKETAEDIKTLVNNIRPDEQADHNMIPSPEDLAPDCDLYPHQRLGLAWMKNMEEGSNKGGILADDMGLGKTIQAIALMVSRRSTDLAQKTTLIVAPVALLRQWESEIRAKVKPERRLSTYIYHGSKKGLTWNELRRYDVVLTTYGMLGSEYSRRETLEIRRRSEPDFRPGDAKNRLLFLDPDTKFYRVILDEAQNIRNKDTKSFKAVSALQAQTRFCMTGTPMMNSVGELYSLIAFLRIKPYNEYRHFMVQIMRPLKGQSQNYTDTAMQKLHALLKAILLRRTKKSEINGQPILTLPPRTTVIEHAVLEGDQLEFYEALESRTQLRFNRYLKDGAVGRFYGAVLLLLLRLRQACCHPHLIRNFEVETNYLEKTPEQLERIAAELLSPEVVRRLVDEDLIDCPICMDAMENSLVFTPCGHRTCSECFTRISDPVQGMDDGNQDRASFRCMTCRGTVDPSKVTDWRAFSKVHMNGKDAEDPLGEIIGDVQGGAKLEPETESDTESETEDEDDDEGSLKDFVVDDDELDEEPQPSRSKGKAKGEDDAEYSEGPGKKGKKRIAKKSKKGKGKAKAAKGKNLVKDKLKHKTLSELQKEGKRNARARRKYFEKLKESWVTSAKIDKCLEILEKITTDSTDEKTIVFSQFTTFLDLIEVPLIDKPWSYKRYDGSMSATARNDAVLEFSNRKHCRVMLVSLKAGNAGLNLTAANHVIILDPFWNPYVEEQAVDRAHRIGQRRPVFVHRILIEGTVEDRIMSIQDRKREMIEGALDENAQRNVARLGTRDLAYLFGIQA